MKYLELQLNSQVIVINEIIYKNRMGENEIR